jgi:hypothetical protein
MAATAAPRTHAILKLKAAGRTRLIVFDTQDSHARPRQRERPLGRRSGDVAQARGVQAHARGLRGRGHGHFERHRRERQRSERAVLKHGDVVKIGEVEITYAETTRAPSSLGPVEFASQLKAFGTPMARVKGDGEATILGMLDAPTTDDEEDFEVRPAGEFEFQSGREGEGIGPRRAISTPRSRTSTWTPTSRSAPRRRRRRRSAEADAKPAPRPTLAPAQAPARKPAPPARQEVWDLDEAPQSPRPAAGPLAITLEIDGLTGELRSAVEACSAR